MSKIIGLIVICAILYSVVTAPFKLVREYKRAQKRTATATGLVLCVRLGKLHWGANVPTPEVEFKDSRGQKFVFHSSSGASWNPWPAGSSVDVFYDPNDPANAELLSARTVNTVLASSGVAYCCIIAAIVFKIVEKGWPLAH